MLKTLFFTLVSLTMTAPAFAGGIVCQATRDAESSNPETVEVRIDWESNGTLIYADAPIGFNHDLVDYTVVYSSFFAGGTETVLVATTATGGLIEITGTPTPTSQYGYHTMKVGGGMPMGHMGKYVHYDLDCDL